MAVQQIPSPTPPTPTFSEQLGTGLSQFLTNYWAYVLAFALAIAGGYAFYLVWKWNKERTNTIFERISKETEQLCESQANPKRKQSNSLIMVGIVGILASISAIMSIIIFGFMGLFSAPLFAFSIILGGGIIKKTLHPFMKSDIIYLRYRDENGIMKERWVGNYLGEYYSSDGYFNLLIQKGRKKLIFRNKLLLRIPQNSNAFFDTIENINEEDDFKPVKLSKEEEKTSKTFIRDILQFNENTIIINYAKSLEKFQFFYYPVFVDNTGEIINNGLRYYKSVKDKAVLEILYEQTDEYAKASVKSIRINPNVQFTQATGKDVIETDESDFKNNKL